MSSGELWWEVLEKAGLVKPVGHSRKAGMSCEENGPLGYVCSAAQSGLAFLPSWSEDSRKTSSPQTHHIEFNPVFPQTYLTLVIFFKLTYIHFHEPYLGNSNVVELTLSQPKFAHNSIFSFYKSFISYVTFSL